MNSLHPNSTRAGRLYPALVAALLCVLAPAVPFAPAQQSDVTQKQLQNEFSEYQAKAEQGDARAQFLLGQCYALGKGVGRDHAKAVNWYRKAAEQNYAEAQIKLGNSYADGQGVKKDYAEAVKWYRKAAEQNRYAEANINLGYCYTFGLGVKIDYAEAYAWCDQVAKTDKSAASLRDDILKKMKPKQVAAAQRRTKELRAQIEAKLNGSGK